MVSADLTPDTVLTTSVEYQHNHSNGFGSGFPLFYSDGSRTDFNRSVANNAPWARQDTEATTYFVDLTHRFTNDWKLRAAYSHTDGRYLMKHVYRGGYPDRHTGIIAAPLHFPTTTATSIGMTSICPCPLLSRPSACATKLPWAG